ISKIYWADRQPDDNDGNEDCVVLLNAKSNIAKWNDLTCSENRKFICEVFPDCPGNTFGERSCPGNFYGPGCSLKCSVHCNGWNNKCDYTGCDNGTYGANCLEKRSAYCGGLDKECDSRTGKCVSGCAIGFKGDKCDTDVFFSSSHPVVQRKDREGRPTSSTYFYSTVAAICALIAISVGFACCVVIKV
ncbi:hypothetical protein RRG08_004240, partial [Elysia crispata]